MQYRFSSIANKLFKPSEFFRYGSLQKRNIYHQLSKVVRRKILNERRAENHLKIHSPVQLCEHIGYLKVEQFQRLDVVINAIKEATSDLRSHNAEVVVGQRKDYLQNVRIQKNLDLEHAYIRLALSPDVLSVVIPYMGFVPILSDIQLWHSPNESDTTVGSQFFHLDHADVRQVKVFLLIGEVSDEMGPTTMVNAEASEDVCNKINYKLSNRDIRIPDHVVEMFCPRSQHTKATGSPGTLFFADTSRCLHYGSRYGTKPRDVLMFQYVSPFSFRYSLNFKKDAKFSHLIKKELSTLERLLLGDVNV